MAITRSNHQQQYMSSDSDTITLADYTVGAGDNRVLRVTGHFQRNSTGSYTVSCTYGGASLSVAVEDTTTNTGGGGKRFITAIWYLLSPTVGTADIVATSSGTLGGGHLSAETLYGVDLDDPIGAIDTDIGQDTSTLDLTGCIADSLIVAGISAHSAGPPTWSWTTATEIYDVNYGSSANTEVTASGAVYDVPSNGNVQITATKSNTSQGQMAVAAEFLAAGGAPPSNILIKAHHNQRMRR